MADRTVESLQRELLAVARGGRFAETWRQVNGIEGHPDLRGELSKLGRIRRLRDQIKAIDPKAARYYGWGGPGDDGPPCSRCDGVGLIADGELTSDDGYVFTEGPIKCFRDCPSCGKGRPL